MGKIRHKVRGHWKKMWNPKAKKYIKVYVKPYYRKNPKVKKR